MPPPYFYAAVADARHMMRYACFMLIISPRLLDAAMFHMAACYV